MASQYDEIGDRYHAIKKLVTSMVEEENVRSAVQPYLTNKPRVLDLACGTGYYSKKAVDWGAGYVLGIDQSPGMVDAARARLESEDDMDALRDGHLPYKARITFAVGDALSEGPITQQAAAAGEADKEEAPFDVVLGCWLLNYATSTDEMTRMFRTIAANLGPGGVFVGLTPAVVDDTDVLAAQWPRIQAAFPADLPVRVRYYERLPSGEGWRTEITNTTGPGPGETVTFTNCHLNRSVYERGAQAAGLGKALQWRKITLSEATRAHLDELGWTTYFDGPEGGFIGILVAEK